MRTDELFGMANGLRDLYDICFGSYNVTNSTISAIAYKCLAQLNQEYSHLFTRFLWRIWHFIDSAHFLFQFINKQKFVTSTINKTISNRFGRCCNLEKLYQRKRQLHYFEFEEMCAKSSAQFFSANCKHSNVAAYNALQI